MFKFWRKIKGKKKTKMEFEYCKQWEFDGISLRMYSDQNIDDEKAEEIVSFIKEKIDIIKNSKVSCIEVVQKIVYQILDGKAMASLWAIGDKELDLYIIYNLKLF